GPRVRDQPLKLFLIPERLQGRYPGCSEKFEGHDQLRNDLADLSRDNQRLCRSRGKVANQPLDLFPYSLRGQRIVVPPPASGALDRADKRRDQTRKRRTMPLGMSLAPTPVAKRVTIFCGARAFVLHRTPLNRLL